MGHPLPLKRIAGSTIMALVAFAAGAISLANAADSGDERIARQRALFLDVYEAAERGDWSDVWALDPAERELLADYVLWPDLRAAYLRATIGESDPDAIDDYLSEYGTLKPARERLRGNSAGSEQQNSDANGANCPESLQ